MDLTKSAIFVKTVLYEGNFWMGLSIKLEGLTKRIKFEHFPTVTNFTFN